MRICDGDFDTYSTGAGLVALMTFDTGLSMDRSLVLVVDCFAVGL